MATLSGHPNHANLAQVTPGVWRPSKPLHPSGLLGWKVRRSCRRSGGHWWHPIGPMIGWFCCQCGAERDGIPMDGT
jgi:hypothetical protein